MHETVDKPINIAMVAACPFPANHGTPGAIRELSIHLAQLGHKVHIITYPQLEENISTDGLIIHRVKPPFMKPGKIRIGPSYERLVYDFFMIFKLIKVIKKHNIQIINAHNYEATMVGAIARLITQRPLVYTGINSMADELPSYVNKLKKLAYLFGKLLDHIVPRTSNFITTLSDDLKEYLQKLGISEKRLIVIPPGVNLEMFTNANGMAIRTHHNIDKETPIIMYTGAMDNFQRIDYLLQAIKLVILSYPKAQLLIVGNIKNPAALEKYSKMAEELGIKKNILFIESVSLNKLPDYLSAADVTVVPRPSCPGYPIKLLNYMAAGKAIVTFKGSAKAICHGYNGYVAKDHDCADLAEGIKLLLSSSELRTTLGNRAQKSIAGVFDWDTLAKGTALLYKKILDNKKWEKTDLNEYIKGGYVPNLVKGSKNPDIFLQTGPVEYPPF